MRMPRIISTARIAPPAIISCTFSSWLHVNLVSNDDLHWQKKGSLGATANHVTTRFFHCFLNRSRYFTSFCRNRNLRDHYCRFITTVSAVKPYDSTTFNRLRYTVAQRSLFSQIISLLLFLAIFQPYLNFQDQPQRNLPAPPFDRVLETIRSAQLQRRFSKRAFPVNSCQRFRTVTNAIKFLPGRWRASSRSSCDNLRAVSSR